MMPIDDQAAVPTISCEEVRDLLHAFVSDELEEEETRAVLQHLAQCGECRKAMAEHVTLSGVLRVNMPSLTKPYFAPPRQTWN